MTRLVSPEVPPRGFGHLVAIENNKWRMSDFVPLTAPLRLQADTVQQVRLRITAEASQWRVDGVAIDPRVR